MIEKDKLFCLHHQNIHRLIEIYKALNNTSENTFSQLFARQNNNIDLCSKPELVVPHTNTAIKDQTYFKYLGSVLRNNLLSEIRNNDFLHSLKMKLKSWKPDDCP